MKMIRYRLCLFGIPPIAYSLMIMVLTALSCMRENTTCRFGDFPLSVALWMLFGGLYATGLVLCVGVGWPIVVMLRRTRFFNAWNIAVASLVIGVLPLLVLCLAGQCIDTLSKYVVFGAAGIAAGQAFWFIHRQLSPPLDRQVRTS